MKNTYSSFDTVAQIMQRNFTILTGLKNLTSYHAHTCDGFKAELLQEHQQLVSDYMVQVCDKLGLDVVINNLITTFVADCFENGYSDKLGQSIKELFCDAIIFHDFGKVNENFQADKDKMNNPLFKSIKSPITTKHAVLSEYLFIIFHLNNKEKYDLANGTELFVFVHTVFAFGYTIAKHHASMLLHQEEEAGFDEEQVLFMSRYIQLWGWPVPDVFMNMWPQKKFIKQGLYEKIGDLYVKMKQHFSLYALIRLNFSLLTASDYLATMHYMNNWKQPYNQLGILSNKLKQKIVTNIRTRKAYNKAVYDNLDTMTLQCPQQPNNENLNRLRAEMSVEIIRNIRRHIDEHLFYIEAPTGGGKTNLSMIALGELLAYDITSHNNIINKIFYVFPFTTLITQTYAALCDTLDLKEDEIIELHSKGGFKESKDEDDIYGNNKKYYIDNLLINYPVVVTSHVNFFDILVTNKKEQNYLLHRIANSVVIIDELQSYDPHVWDKLMYLIDNYARQFNIRFILMSATLPKVGKLLLENYHPIIISLINDKNKYFKNENFRGRVRFDFSLLDWPKPKNKEEKSVYLKKLCNKLFDESKHYGNITGRVFTIIEFIFKRTASSFCVEVENMNNGFFDHVFVLSGTILEPRRKEIIEFLKNTTNKHKNVLLITTQVVEAGVDIDMDLGFKDRSLVDSDEQLAGRINRNVNKPQCTLFIFDCDDEKFIYGKDKRLETLKDFGATARQEYEKILEEKNFDRLYNKVIDKRNRHNSRDLNIGLSDFYNPMLRLDFAEVSKQFILIENENCSIFVQIDVPLKIPGTEKNNFSEGELNFLEQYHIYNTGDDHISGKAVWNLYKQIIQFKSDDFIDQKIKMKKMQSILSRFMLSIFAHSKDIQQLIDRGYKDADLGFIVLSDIDDNKNTIYKYESGFVDEKLEEAMIF